MLPDKQKALLGDILIYARKILVFSEGVSRESFEANEEKQFAVIRCLEVMGEAVTLLSPEAQQELPLLQLRLIRGMRNRLVRDYRNVNTRIIWETVSQDILPLVSLLEEKLNSKEWGGEQRPERLTIRTMTRPEVDFAVEWAAAEGWNPGLHDADSFYAADASGFLIGLLGDEPVAVISAVKYGATFGFLGFYIVKPGYRGRGYGRQIWDAAMASLAGRVIGLDGVVAQQDNYRQSGFTLAYRNIRYQGVGGGSSVNVANVVPLSTVPFADVLAYDRPFFPADREAFLQSWIQLPQGTALGLVENGVLAGYGMIRACRAGHKIGPLFADSPAGAETLFLALKAAVPAGDAIYFDPPEANPAAVDLARRHGMSVVFETARMYAGPAPTLPLDRLFGVTSFELG